MGPEHLLTEKKHEFQPIHVGTWILQSGVKVVPPKTHQKQTDRR